MKKAAFEDIVQTAGMAAIPNYNCQLTDALSKQKDKTHHPFGTGAF